jgi:uncharacterized protein YecT (DUF1311 family)
MNALLKSLLHSGVFVLSCLSAAAQASDAKTAGARAISVDRQNAVENLDPAIQGECRRLDKVEFPASDRPTAEQEKGLKNCDAENFYYGIKTKIDYIKARHCAFSIQNREQAQNDGVLMMLYANGQGVTRNYTIAKKAACSTDAAPMEIVGWMQHLTNMGSGNEGDHPKIDICDDITSGFMQGYCARIQSELADQAREQKFARLTSNWNTTEQGAFQKLKKQAEAFIAARSDLEVDQTGTARSAEVLEEASTQKEDLLKSLEDFEAGNLPTFLKDDYVELDRELNQVYLQLKQAKDPEFSTVKIKDIQRAQRAWLAYREAWVRFGKAKYPSIPVYAWKAYFTKKRTEMLKELLADRE